MYSTSSATASMGAWFDIKHDKWMLAQYIESTLHIREQLRDWETHDESNVI